jgi:hypothetical protein
MAHSFPRSLLLRVTGALLLLGTLAACVPHHHHRGHHGGGWQGRHYSGHQPMYRGGHGGRDHGARHAWR